MKKRTKAFIRTLFLMRLKSEPPICRLYFKDKLW